MWIFGCCQANCDFWLSNSTSDRITATKKRGHILGKCLEPYINTSLFLSILQHLELSILLSVLYVTIKYNYVNFKLCNIFFQIAIQIPINYSIHASFKFHVAVKMNICDSGTTKIWFFDSEREVSSLKSALALSNRFFGHPRTESCLHTLFFASGFGPLLE